MTLGEATKESPVTLSYKALCVGRGDRVRTYDLLTPSQTRYQTAPHPVRTRVYETPRGKPLQFACTLSTIEASARLITSDRVRTTTVSIPDVPRRVGDVDMSRTIGIGVIAMGWMGPPHSRAYRQPVNRFPDYGIEPRLVVCADAVEARAREAKERFCFERSTVDWREVIADPDVEVVNITSPNNLHAEMACAAAAAGKHVFCEKPLGRNAEETATIEKATHQAGVMSFTGFCYRWAPLVQWVRQLVVEGRLGRITHYRGRFLVGYGGNPDGVLCWRFDREVAGSGSLGDIMSHAVDMAHFFVGPISSVVSQSKTYIPERPLPTPGEGTHFSVGGGGPKGAVTNEDYVGALIRFECGANGTLEACRVIVGEKCEMAFELNGTLGGARWNCERMNELRLHLPEENQLHDGYARIYSDPQHPFHSRFAPGPAAGLGDDDLAVIEVAQFLKGICDGSPVEPSFHAILEAARVNAAMEVPGRVGAGKVSKLPDVSIRS